MSGVRVAQNNFLVSNDSEASGKLSFDLDPLTCTTADSAMRAALVPGEEQEDGDKKSCEERPTEREFPMQDIGWSQRYN